MFAIGHFVLPYIYIRCLTRKRIKKNSSLSSWYNLWYNNIWTISEGMMNDTNIWDLVHLHLELRKRSKIVELSNKLSWVSLGSWTIVLGVIVHWSSFLHSMTSGFVFFTVALDMRYVFVTWSFVCREFIVAS